MSRRFNCPSQLGQRSSNCFRCCVCFPRDQDCCFFFFFFSLVVPLPHPHPPNLLPFLSFFFLHLFLLFFLFLFLLFSDSIWQRTSLNCCSARRVSNVRGVRCRRRSVFLCRCGHPMSETQWEAGRTSGHLSRHVR